MSVHVVVPVKEPRNAKTRLAQVLSLEERARLTATMLRDVCAALGEAARAGGIEAISILTGDAALVPSGLGHIADAGSGLNAALAQAARELVRRGAAALLIVPADVPFVEAADLRTLIGAARAPALAIAPDRSARGTNALLISPPQLITPQFGPHSFAAHRAAGEAVGVPVQVMHCPGLECDIDEPADLKRLMDSGREAYAFLRATRAAGLARPRER